MKEFSFLKKLVNLIETTLKYTEIKVETAKRVLILVKVTTGLRQGMHFHSFSLTWCWRRLSEKQMSLGFSLGQTNVGLIAYVDDIAIIGNSVEEVKSFCRRLKKLRKQGSIIRTVIENNPVGKPPLGRLHLRWEDCLIKMKKG